jgi:hypothetical protein
LAHAIWQASSIVADAMLWAWAATVRRRRSACAVKNAPIACWRCGVVTAWASSGLGVVRAFKGAGRLW